MNRSFDSLDPAEVPPSPRAFVQYEENRRKYTDQRDAVQKKTFTKWVNKHLLKAGRRIVDLFEGFKDGHNLLSLLEVLSHEALPRERGRMRFHQIQNVQIALEFLRRKGIRLVNIRSDEIVDGNPKLTLGLVWTIILHYQVSDVVVPGQPEDITAKEALLLWSRRTTDSYPGVQVRNFTTSWRDGKAFLSIIHRNRPDLVDFRRVQTQTARQNLEQAFSTAEREFGVTRLLDPEDVDVPEPDEKSVITYVSSLYDVFPEVPTVEQSLMDNERQLKIDEYKDMTSSLVSWLQDIIMMMSQRNFPSTLIEMKSLLADLNRFKIEDVPPRLEMRKKALRLFDEIQSTGAAHLVPDDELYPDNVNRLWNRYEHIQQERDMAIQAEIVRLERLQRLAEKIHRESKHSEDSLNDIERRICDEERRVEILHPYEAKRNCDALERAMKTIEDTVRSLLRDAQALQDARYTNSDQMYRRVATLQSRVSQLRTELYSNVIQKLISKSYVEEGITTTRRREVVTEVKLVESNPAFRHVQYCLNWIEAKQNAIEGPDLGTDAASIQASIEQHQEDHREIQAFRQEIENCKRDFMTLSPDEQELYTEWLSKVEVAFSLLNNTSSRRLKGLESLQEFIQAATQELMWLNEKEEIEVTRDWSSRHLNVPTVEEFYKNLIQEMKVREAQFNSVQDRGNSMVLDRHPQSKTIEVYMSEMQSQWSWLLQLSVCLDAHVKHASAYYQFFEEASECEQWMSRQSDSISSRYTDENQSIDTLNQLLKELQELSAQIADYERQVSSLTIRSREIIPLKQRGQPVFSELRCRCLCIYKQPPLVLQKGEEITLLDNSQKIRWRIRTSSGQEDLIPSVCILIPPPNYEAIEFADRLKIQMDHLQSLLKMRQRKLRHNMVNATINLIRNWDIQQFQSLDPARREALLRALNEDAAKLIAEVGEGDREMRQLRDRLNECNQNFQRLAEAVSEEERNKTRGPNKDFLQKLDSVSYQLSSLDQDLQLRVQQPLPHDRHTLDIAKQQQGDWERSLQNQEGPVEQVRLTYNKLGMHSPQAESKIDFINGKWDQMITLGNTYAERMKVLDGALSKLDNLRHFLADQEVILGSQDSMSSEPRVLKSQRNEIQNIQQAIEQRQSVIDSLTTHIGDLRSLVEKSRPGVARHHDLEVLEKDVSNITTRWGNVKEQVNERLTSLTDGVDSLTQYTNGLSEEQDFVAETQAKIQSEPPLSPNLDETKKLVQPTLGLYNSLREHQHQIEAVNRHGGQFIREAKIYDKKLQQYQDQLHSIDEGLAEGFHKRPRRASGVESVKTELDALNRQYIDQVLWANTRLKDISAIFADANIDIQFPGLITERAPLLRTFRAELAKRSSMLVDEDMQEYFQQLSEFEGYGGLQAMGRTGQTFGSQSALNLATKQEMSTSLPHTVTVRVTKATPSEEEIPKYRTVDVSATMTAQATPVKWRLKSPPVSTERLSQKVASLSSLSGLSTGSDENLLDEVDSLQPYPGQTLITVKQGCLAPKGTHLNVSAILNSKTGRKVTLTEAIKAGVLDVKSGTIVDSRTNEKMTLKEAVTKRYISNDLYKQLASSCGIVDPYSGEDCTLLQAIQKDLFNPENSTVKDTRSGKFVSLEQAVSNSLLSRVDADNIRGEGSSVTFITQSQAVFNDQDLKSSTKRLGLGEIIERGWYVPESGKIVDPITGREITILDACDKGFINPNKEEINDSQSKKQMSLIEAVSQGVIDPESGKYVNKSNNQKLSLDEAFQRKLISSPFTLSRALSEGVILDNGRVQDPESGRTLSFQDALDTGIIDFDSKCVVDALTGEVLSVSEAIELGLVDSKGFFIHKVSGKRESFIEAVDKGHLKLVQEDLVISKPCVLDTKLRKSVTVAQAIKQGIITSNGELIDTSSGRRILLKAAAGQGFIDKDIADKLVKETSVKDASGRNISFLKAIQIGLISPENVEVRHPTSRKSVGLQQAAAEGIISTEDAQSLLEILSPVIAHTTVVTRLQPGRVEAGIASISVSDAISRGLLNERTGTFRDPNTGASMPVETAIEKGLLKLSSEWPSSTVDSSKEEIDRAAKNVHSDAERWLKQITEEPEMAEELRKTGKATVESKVSRKKGDDNYSFTQTVVTRPEITETQVSEEKHIQVQSVFDPRTKREISVHEAVHRGLIDMTQGVYIHPVTDERMSVINAISRGFVRGLETSQPGPGTSSVKDTKSFSITGVIHPRTGKRLTVSEATKDGFLDLEKGLFKGVDSKGKMINLKISEAVEHGYVLTDTRTSSTQPGGGFIQETKTYQLKSVIHPVTKERLDVADAIKQGIVDEHKGIYMNPRTGEKMSIPDAIEKKLIDAELMAVISNAEGEGSKIITTKLTTLMVKFVLDPRTGDTISVVKALEEGILDQTMEHYINPLTGEVLALNDAIDRKLVIAQAAAITGSVSSSTESIHINPDEEVTESNLIEEISSETVTFSINNVIDPRTMEMMSYDEAVLYGVLDLPKGLYVNPMTGESMPINVALDKGLIHGEVTSKTKSEDLMHSSVSADSQAFPLRNITSVLDPRNGEEISLDKAIKDRIIDPEKATYYDMRRRENISLDKALSKGFIKLSKATDADDIERMRLEHERRESERERRHKSVENGIEPLVDMKMEKFGVSGDQMDSVFPDEVLNYSTEIEQRNGEEKGPLTFDAQQGVRTWRKQEFAVKDTEEEPQAKSPMEVEHFEIFDLTDGMSFQTAMTLGLIDQQTGKIRDPKTGQYISIDDAIAKDVLDENKPALVDLVSGRTLTLRQCVQKGIVNPDTGKINERKAKSEKITLTPSISTKQSRGRPMNLLDAIGAGLFDTYTELFTEPNTGRSFTLKEAVNQGVLDGNLVTVADLQSKEKLSLSAALRQGLIDGVTSEVINTETDEKIPLLEAVSRGLIENVFDKESGMVYDTLTGKSVPLDKALTDGQLRSDEAKVFDTVTGQMVPLDVAFRKGLVDMRTGSVTDKKTGKKMSPQDALKLGVLAIVGAPVLASKAVFDVIKDKAKMTSKPVKSRRSEELSPSRRINGVSPVNGEISQSHVENYQEIYEQPRTTIVYAKPGDRIKPSSPRQLFVEEDKKFEDYKITDSFSGQLADSFDKLNQDLWNEMNWLSDVEQLLKDDQPVNEEAYKAQCQREAMKALHEDVLKHQQPIRSLVYQSEQLVEHHQEELTPEQVTELQHLESSIKTSFGKVQKTCDSRVKHLSAATEELTKFEDELKKFDTWSEATDKELDRQMEEVQKSDNIRRVTELHKEMTSDILDHGADLRYLSFAVQKYMEEAKLHKLELEAYKADRLKPSRLSRTSWIAMDNKEVEVVKDKQKDAESRYKDLKSRCNSFGEKLSLLTSKQKEFNDNTWGMLSWLTDAEEKLSMTRQEASAPEPEALRDHLEKMKAIANDAITHKNNLAELEKSAKDVVQAMSDLGVGGDQVEKIRDIITDISGRHDIVLEEINEKANALQTAVTKSQDVQDAVEQLLTWLKETDRKLEQLKPVSLNQDKLNEQAQKLNIVETDIESHKPSIDSVRQAASELIKTCDLDMAKTLESKISDLGSKFFNAQKKCRARAKEVQDVSEKLNKFNKQLESCKTWVGNNSDTLQSLELSKMPVGQLKIKVDSINLEKGRQLQAMEKVQALGHELLEDSRTGDPAAVKMALNDLEKMWTKFDECLAERESEASVKESRGNEYEEIKNHVVAWLARMEGDVNAFEPVAVDMDIVAKQIEELQPLLEEYYEFSPKIDELNDIGNAYDAIQSGDSRPKSPMRFRGRRIPSSVLSPRLRSPSPTTGSFSFPQTSDISPMSISSDSSGVGSRKSSSDYLQLDDLSETQQDILDMNQRYEMLEERLLDRQQELQGMLETVKSFLQDLSDIFSWLDLKERDLEGNVAIATSEKEARKRLKEHEHEHAELLSKDGTVEEIKKKGQDLIKRKRGVPGIDMVQQQLIELDDKWQGVKAASNEQRKLHEDIVSDLRTYKDAGVHLQKWIAQKEKMVAVLGPVATEPSMIKNQLEQVKVLHEELRGQEPLYDKFIQAGNAVHDKCVPESKDAAHISEKMTVISKSWDRLSDRLREREKSLVSVEGLSKEFSDNVSQLGNWVADYMMTIDQLQPVTTNPEKHQEHLREIKELEWELKKQAPVLERAKELAKKLSDNTKDGSTKLELRNKVSNLEKPMAEAEKKLVMRRNEVEKASAEGDKFRGSCQDLLALIDEIKDKQRQMAPVSGDADVLKDQAQHNKEILKDLANLAPEIKVLTDKAKMFGEESSPAAKALLAQVDLIQKEWEDLQMTANQREEQLQASTKHAQNFQAQLDKMSLWLQLSEDKLDGLTPEALDTDTVAKKLKEAQALRGDILKLTHQQESLNREGQSLMNTVDSDKGTIKVRLEDINHRWDNLNEGLTERIQSLEDLSGRLTEFGTYNEDLNSSLKKLEDKLDAHFNLGSTAKDPKYQDKIANMQEDASALTSQIYYLEGLLSGLDDVDGSAPREHILDLEKSRDRQSALQQQLQELLDDMEAGTQIVDQFQGTIKKAGSKLGEMEAELNHMSPVARDESTLGMQERQIEEFISRLNDIDHILDEVENQYKALQADGYVTAADGLAVQLENLKAMQERIQEQSADRKTEIKDASNTIDTVTDNLRRMRTSIDRAGDELEMHDPIGSDVNAIKRMQDELKEFQRTVLENVSRKVQAATMESQGLIQSAAPGVDTSGLEADQESLMDKWNSLNAKVSERDRNLDNAILQSGKFNDAFMSLMDWLKDTEELVGNQKPPSPDFKVAKAQLQEQKFLLKMLDDRYPSVKSVKDSGETLQKNLQPQEKKAIQNQIAQLDKRWEALNSNAQERAKTLENIMGIAQEFQDAREPLISWLDGAEKKFAGLEPSAMDVDGIVNIINALEDIEGDLNSKDGQVKQLAAVAKELQNHCKGDDVKNVQRKIDDVQNRFAELSDKLSDTHEQMEEALPLAKNFNDAHAKFIDWIVKIEPKARTKEAQEPEDQVVQLLESLKEIEPVLEVMTNDGGQLAELVPGDAGFKVEDTIAKDMKRFEGVNDAIQKKAEKFRSAKQKSVEVMGTIDDLLEWFEEAEGKLTTAQPISCEPKKLQSQLSDQKAMNEDINAQKAKARDMIAAGKRLLRESSMDDEGAFNDKMDTLKQQSDAVAKLCSDRMVQLEQAMPLSKTFLEAHQDLLAWFTEVEPAIAELEVMSINQDTVKKQQDKVKVLKQDIQDNKPLVDKLNKTGTALSKLYLSEDDLDLVKSTVDDDNRRVEDIRRATRDRSMSIDEALQQSAEFTDKLENMLDTLTATEEQITNAEPVSAHPDKIREQIGENNALLEDMQMRLSALESVRNAAEDLIKQASDDQDEAVQDVKAKLRELVKMFEKINDGAQERNAVLEDTLEVSDKFWDELQGLTQQLKALSDTIANQEPPALEPAIIREQQETLEAMRDDIEASQFDLDEVHQTGEQLMSLCGEPDRPEVQKNIDDLDNSLLTITGEFDKRSRTLEEALERSMYFQEELMKTLVWLQKREDRLKEFQPVASNFDTIKDQWNEVKLFKSEVEPKHSDIESLNQKADELVKDSSPDQAVVVKEPMSAVNRRWDGLLDGIGDRQRELQLAMLDVGQFEHAMNELLAWLDKTEQTLDECKPVYGDRKLVEIELAKHKVLQNDIHAHAPSVKSIQEAGQRAVMTEGGKSSARKRKLDDMTRLWNEVQEKSNHRQEELEDALREAKEFSEQMEKTLVRLGQIEGMLITSRPVGGLPETAKEQLERFMEVYNELQDLEPVVGKLHTDGNKLIRKSQDPSASNIKQNMQLLQQSWEHIKTRSEDRKGKLEQAVNQANSFHGDLNTFIAWLTDTEKILNNMKPVSRVIDHVTEQIKDQKALQKDIQVHREAMIKLDKTGTHLKYFSQKQDVVLIKNLLASVQQRWEKIVSRTAERTRHLERGFKEAKQFNDMMGDMLGWLADAEQLLTSEYTVGNDPAKIKGQIAKHKEFQKSLGAKQPIYDNINRAGRSLKERSPDEDHPVIQDKLKDLKEKWNSVCGKSVDRQRKLEEALLFSGQFNDALEALLDWLAKVEPGLGEDQMVHGDIDTVNNLVEEHKAFQQELGARANNVSFVRKRAKELLEKAEEDTSQQQAQLIELSTMWDRVCKLSVNKQERLQQAQKLADDFQKKAHNLITWLASAERQLRYKGPLPDDEAGIMKQMEEHKAFEEDFLRQEGTLRETLNIGQDIMKRCHPDAVSTMKHWLSVLKARWEEVSGWSRQRGTRLRDGLANFRRTNALLEELIAWLNGAENKLFNDNAEPIPDDAEIIVGLIKDHQDFQNEMSGKQPEIDQLTKSDRRRTTSMSGEPVSHIPMFKGLSGRRTPVKFGSLRRGHDDGRRTPEPHFKNPRVGALFNKWRQVWLVSMDRHRRLQEALDYLNELERMKNFKFEDWRKRYLTWMHHNKSRIMDFFRRQDRDRDGKVTRAEFIEGIMASRFQTTPMEMEAVANIFDRDGDGFVDYKEFVSALRPDRDPRPETDAEMIQDEVKRQVTKCTCVKQYRIHKIGEGKYRFGDSQKLRLVRILRSTVMVRVGGGWMALDEFLVKNDPCRAKGRTNVELREQFTLASGVSQSMAGFVSKSPSGSSYSGSSTYSGATSPWSTRSPSSAGGPVIRVRERTQYATPWRQNIQKTYKNSPDGEVRQILSSPTPEGSRYTRGKLAPRDQASPRHLQSPGTTGTPASRSSSRASTGSRPFSPTGSENSEISEPEVFTTVQSETRNVGGRNETTRTYQTHVVQTRTVNTPTRMGSSTPTRMSKIPKLTPKKR